MSTPKRVAGVGSGLGVSWAARRGAAAGLVWRCRIRMNGANILGVGRLSSGVMWQLPAAFQTRICAHGRDYKACTASKEAIGRWRSISRLGIKHDLHRRNAQSARFPAKPVCGSRAQRLPGRAHVPMIGRAGQTRLGTRRLSVGGGRCPGI